MRILVDIFGVAVVASMSVIIAVSFTAIIYSGPLAPLLDRGIGTTLLAAGILAGVGAILFSYKATVANPQDLTAILLTGGAASIAAQMDTGDALLATVLALLAMSALTAGATMIVLGRLRLSKIIRFIPYPVMGGFLAATGYMLTLGAIGSLIGEHVTIWSVGRIIDAAWLWLPWMLLAAGILIAVRTIGAGFVLPACIALACAGFYAALAVAGISLADAADRGLLLGPFGSGGFLTDLHPKIVTEISWPLIADQALLIIGVTAMTVLGGGLNLSGIELAVRSPMNPDRDFIAIGASNMLAAPTGGLIGFPGVATTLLGHRLGLQGALPGLSVSMVCMATAFFGASALETLPAGLFAAVIGFLGLDLLFTWLWIERKRLLARDFSVVILILTVSALLGFLEALAIGFALSVVLFVVSYARQDFVRLRTDLSARRSTIERSTGEVDHLAKVGERVRIFEFSGYLFFGTAARLRTMVLTTAASEDAPEAVILDFTRVQGIDPSAAHALRQVSDGLAHLGVECVNSGLSAKNRDRMERYSGLAGTGAIHDGLDDALQWMEERLLARRPQDDRRDDGGTFLDTLQTAYPDLDLLATFPSETIEAGAHLIRMADRSTDMFVLLSGHMLVRVAADNDTGTIVARLGPGSLIGEIAFYGDARRVADVIAVEQSRVLRIDRGTLSGLEKDHPRFVAALFNLSSMHLARRMDRTNRLLNAALA